MNLSVEPTSPHELGPGKSTGHLGRIHVAIDCVGTVLKKLGWTPYFQATTNEGFLDMEKKGAPAGKNRIELRTVETSTVVGFAGSMGRRQNLSSEVHCPYTVILSIPRIDGNLGVIPASPSPKMERELVRDIVAALLQSGVISAKDALALEAPPEPATDARLLPSGGQHNS